MGVNLIDPATGKTFEYDESEVPDLVSQGWRVEGGAELAQRLSAERKEADYGGVTDKIAAGALAVARGATLGGSDVLLSAAGLGDDVRNLRDVNSTISTVGEIGGGLLLPGGAAVKGAEGAGALARLGRAAVAGVKEGAIQGAGSGVSELALSDDPLTIERVVGTLGSHTLYGGAIGGAAGTAARGLEIGLRKGASFLDDIATRGEKAASIEGVADDLAGMDAKALRGARKAELDAIEAARVPQRSQLADDITTFRKDMKTQKVWLATQGAEEAELRAIGKRTFKADKQLDNLIDDPKYFAENPKGALSALRKQEAALDELVNKHGESLRAKFAGDASGARVQALDNAAAALERNRALQQRITDLAASPTSARLTAIDDAKDLLVTGAAGKGQKTLAQQMLGGTVFSGVTGAVAALPIPGAAFIAPMLGSKAAGFVGEQLTGRLAEVQRAAAKRTAGAINAFLDVTKKVPANAAPVLASKTLAAVRYSQRADDEQPKPAKGKKETPEKIADLYKRRTSEIRDAVELGPDGKTRMRADARARMAATFAPVKAMSPIAADKMETLAAAKLTFLADKMPRRPDLGGLHTGGPDLWQPSDMEMRTWARYAAAVEDPGGIEERLASATLTPEDAEVMKALYPERLAEITRQVIEQLPTLQKRLPYERRLALSILTGVPVDPAMNPRVLSVLQQQFTEEPGTEGGTQAPKPSPQFGSVKVDEPTPAQQRSA